MPDIIPLNKKDDDIFSPRGDPISDNEFSVDSYVGCPTWESEGYEYVFTLPTTATHISPEGVTPTNNSPIGDNTQEGDATPIQHQPYQRNQWPEAVWERCSDNKIKKVQLNKFNQ